MNNVKSNARGGGVQGKDTSSNFRRTPFLAGTQVRFMEGGEESVLPVKAKKLIAQENLGKCKIAGKKMAKRSLGSGRMLPLGKEKSGYNSKKKGECQG